ncbi:hypothetical protein L6164_026524 [Bauhinia variegata]|uniref:Uncharacterized protein n=1 Tax=Bauhinia variegata TaxID=167791 RepID=A0ACB9LQV0_BAUVA|nr:hypothetical protein L6164_026524 [Bauhinia variegata]
MAFLHQQNGIYFFRILLERSLQFLRIPRKFSRKYGFNLPNPVFLKPPDGTEWKIFWMKSDGEIWFKNGWKEFVRHYSLESGYLVLFNGDSDEILGEKTPHLKAKSKLSPLSSPRPQKKPKVGTNGEFEPSSSLKSIHFPVLTEGRELGKSINGNPHLKSIKEELEEDHIGGNVFTHKKCPNSEKKTRMQTLTATEKTEALKRAKSFRSENPFFTLIIQPSYVSNNSPLNIPSKFVEEHMEKKQGTVILEVLGGRTWSATYIGHKMCSGWYKFARDNNLKVGDVCVFEMTNSIELSFKVSIYRVPQDPSCSFSQGKTSKPKVPKCLQNSMKNEALGKAMSAKFSNPIFKVFMQKAYVSGRSDLRVPLEFAKKYLNVKMDPVLVTLRSVDGRLWSVKYISRLSQGRLCYELRRGWKQFVLDNNLQIGDVCVFELIDRIKLTFDVTIFRDAKDGAHLIYSVDREEPLMTKVKSENSNICDQFRSQVKFGGKSTERTSTSLLKHGGITRFLKEVEKFESDNPYFTLCIKPYHLQRGKPFVPKDFCKSCTKEREKSMLIQIVHSLELLNCTVNLMYEYLIPNESKAFEKTKSYKSWNPSFKFGMEKSRVHGRTNLDITFRRKMVDYGLLRSTAKNLVNRDFAWMEEIFGKQ